MRRPMIRGACGLLLVVALGAWGRMSAEGPTMTTADSRWERASDAWAAGRYPAALEDLRAILASPDAARVRDRIAQLTGGIFATIDVDTDGRAPRLSAAGDLLMYETGAAEGITTRLVRIGDDEVTRLSDIPGLNAAFNSDGSAVVYLRPPATPDWPHAWRALDDARTRAERQVAQIAIAAVLGRGDLVVRDVQSGAERVLAAPGLVKAQPAFAADGRGVFFIGAPIDDRSRTDIFEVAANGTLRAVTRDPGPKTGLLVDPSGNALVYTIPPLPIFTTPEDAASPGAKAADAPRFAIVDLVRGATQTLQGSAVTMSADGSTIAWLVHGAGAANADRAGGGADVGRAGAGDRVDLIYRAPLATRTATTVVSGAKLDAPALSPDGASLAYQCMTGVDWDIYLADAQGAVRRLTRDARHDVRPRFLTPTTILAMTGETRDRRAYVYDLDAGTRTRLFTNDTIRTISPEYAWAPAGNGRRIAVEADRDGDTVSPGHTISVVDLDRQVTVADLAARVDAQLAAETDLRRRMTAAFEPIASLVADVVSRAAINRVYDTMRALVDFDSKYITEPGNQRAIDYLDRAYRSFGYQPALQWFEPKEGDGHRTANVVVVKNGTVSPSVIYVVSSHFDSVLAGPGADDDCSGTAALVETARLLADTPLPATVVFASLTGEEAGLLGSREFVRRAAADHWHVAAALNNDMIGWSADGFRIDNTVRYSNAGIRDVQHGAAFLFTHLITYDAKYYRNTDAQAFNDEWGDVVGGLGSYPVLANPNYHQASDLIETVNFAQVTESAKATTAALIYLASSPSPLSGLHAERRGDRVDVSWKPSVETDVTGYLIAYGPAADPLRSTARASEPHASLPPLDPGDMVSVKAVNARGLEGWDWTRVVIK